MFAAAYRCNCISSSNHHIRPFSFLLSNFIHHQHHRHQHQSRCRSLFIYLDAIINNMNMNHRRHHHHHIDRILEPNNNSSSEKNSSFDDAEEEEENRTTIQNAILASSPVESSSITPRRRVRNRIRFRKHPRSSPSPMMRVMQENPTNSNADTTTTTIKTEENHDDDEVQEEDENDITTMMTKSDDDDEDIEIASSATMTNKIKPDRNNNNNNVELWLSQLEKIREFRATHKAPVDEFGCEACSRFGESDKDRRFHVLVSLMLSSQTKDQITAAAMKNLREKLPGGLTVRSVLMANEALLRDLIYPAGFYKRKAEYLKKTAAILQRDYDGDIPSNLKELVALPGVGPKMAHIAMNVAWNQPVGIGVDVHVHRIANRLGWVHDTKTPEKTREELEQWLPREHWADVNLVVVGFGQVQCLPVNPKCASCPVRDTCPTGQKNLMMMSSSTTTATATARNTTPSTNKRKR